ncbi:MAG: S-layer homology domain-containing protein [Firmicutes bacterium]|nr:S-layer homology domain-containing protein [Bacillota bacterium]
MNFTKKLQKNKLFLAMMVFVLCLGLVFTAQSITNASVDPANNGNDLDSLTPTEAGLAIGGEGITKGLGFQQNFYYLSKADLDAMKEDADLVPTLLGGSAAWQENVLYSSYDNHGTPNYIYRAVSGLNLKTALTALGADVSGEAVNLEAKATDGYTKVVFDAFGVESPRIYYAPDGTGGEIVDPSLAFYETKVATGTPDAGTTVPKEAGTEVKEYPLFVFGQTAADDHTGCSFVKDTIKIRLGADSPVFSLTVEDTTKSISLSDLVLLGVYETSYSYSKNDVVYTHNLKGIPLDKLLTAWKITLDEGQTLTMNVNDGEGVYAYSSRTIAPKEVSKCFLAYEAVGSDGSSVDNATSLRLYCPGEFGNAVMVKNVVGASIAAGSTGEPTEQVAYTVYNYQTKSRDSDPDLTVPNAPWDSETFYGEVGSQVTVNAVEIPGRVATESSQTITLDADSGKNTVIFRYGLNAGLLIAGNGLDKDIYYSPAELRDLANDSGNITRYYSGMKKGGIPSVIVGRGIGLVSILNDAGISATQGQITIKTTASDGYGSFLKYDLANSQFVPQGYYFPDIFNASEAGQAAVNPMLAFYRLDYDQESGGAAPTVPNANELPPLNAWEAATDFPHPTIMLGQSSVNEYNVMNFAKMLFAVEVDAPQVLQVDWLDSSGAAKAKKATLANIIIKGLESCEANGTTYQGIKLDRLLGAWSIPVAAGEQIQVLNKSDQILSVIPAENKGDYLVAINISAKQIDRNNPISLVDLNTGAVQELSSIVVGEDKNEGETGKKAPGGDIANSVFYLAVNDGNGDTKFYYYTKEELEALETEEAYYYNDHSVKKTVTAKGALLSTLLNNITGVTITPDMIIQYAEEDGYHAAANETVPDSYYKDTVESLTEATLWGSGSTKLPTRTIITYLIHEEYQNPDEFNVNDPEGVFKDADKDSGYLRAYRETGSGQDDANIGGANATVIKYLLGVAVSKDGKLLSGGDGCTVQSVSDKNGTISVRSNIVYKGLVPGMQYAVRAPQVTNANLADGESATQTITVGTGTTQIVTFKYKESPYFYVKNTTTGEVTNYTYTDLVQMGIQVPEAGTAPYGYQKPMYYRYNGVYLNSLIENIQNISSVELVAKDGSKTSVAVADLNDYFVAYNNTQSKSSTNIPEGKRVTVSYPDAKVILPATGENVTGAEPTDYTPGGKDVDVAVEEAEGVLIKTTKSSGGSTGGGAGGSIKQPVAKGDEAHVSGGTIVPALTSGNNDQVEARVEAEQIKTAVNNSGSGSVGLEISAPATTESIVCTIPQAGMEALVKGGSESLMLNTSLANMTFAQDTLTSLKDLAGDIKISVGKADQNNLSPEAKNIIGDRPIYEFSVLTGGKNITEFGGNITITLPYTLAPGENAGNIVIYYLDSNGKPQLVSNCIYNADKGVITFVTNHFSTYGVGYAANDFADTKNHWAKDSIDFVTAREMFRGTGEATFSPDIAMTRGMLVTVLGRFDGAGTEAKASFSDVSVDAYYAPYIAWASENGIVKGIGNNQFAPDDNVTREQMAVILDNYCSFAGIKLASTGSAAIFADSSSISSWAVAGIQSMQKASVISGKENNIFAPKGHATRAEVSTMLHRLIKNSIGSVNQDVIEAGEGVKDNSGNSNNSSNNDSSSNEDSEDDSPYLTISGSQVAEPVKLSLNDMQDMGLQTFTFTGRNKLYDNARQTFEITGVTLADLLAAAGASSDATSLKVICSDGYVKVYDLQRLLADAYSYSYSDEGELVPAVIAIQENGAYYDGGEGNPFRLIMGQADWDNDETKDFNMQNWAKNLKEIVID